MRSRRSSHGASDGRDSTAVIRWLLAAMLFGACQAPSVPTPAPPGWGPLAVVPAQDGSDAARTEGTLRIVDGCVVLVTGVGAVLLLWPADRTTWDPRGTITFTAPDGTATVVTDGDHVAVGGSGDSNAERGITSEQWLAETPWVQRPDPSCPLESRWWVGALAR